MPQRRLGVIIEYTVKGAEAAAQAGAKVTQGIKEMTNKSSGALGKFQSIFQSAFGKVKGFVSDLVAHSRWASLFVTAYLGQMASAAVEMTADFERTIVGFEFLVGGAEKAREVLEELQDLAVKTTFPIDDTIDFGKRLKAAGIPTEEIVETLESLMAVTTATGGTTQDLNRVVRAYSQMQSMAKLKTQELWQMVNAGIPVYDDLAKAIRDGKLKVEGLTGGTVTLGGATKDLTDAFGKAREMLPVLEKRLEAARMDLKEMRDEGEEGTATFLRKEATIKNYEDRINKLTADVGAFNAAQANQGEVVEVAGASLREIKGALMSAGDLNISGADAARVLREEWQETYGNVLPRLQTTVSGQWQKLREQLDILKRKLLGVSTQGRRTGSMWQAIYDILVPVNEFLEEHTDTIVEFTESLDPMVLLFGVLFGLFGAALPALLGIVGQVILLGTMFGAIGVVIGKLINKFGGLEKVINFVRGVFDKLCNLVESVAKFIVNYGAEIASALAGIVGVIFATLIPAFIAWLAAAAETVAIMGIIAVETAIAAAPIVLIGAAIGLLGLLVYRNWEKIKEAFNSGLAVVKNVAQGISDSINSVVQKTTNSVAWLKTIITGFIDLLIGGDYTREFGKALGICEDSPLVLGVIAFRDKVLNTVESLKTGIINIFVSVKNAIVNTFNAAKTNIENWITFFREDFFGALGYLVGSIVGLVLGAIAKILKEYITWWGEMFTQAVKGIGMLVRVIWNGFKKSIADAKRGLELIVEFVKWAVNKQIETWKAMPGIIMGFIKDFVKSIVDSWKRMWELIKSIDWKGLGSFILNSIWNGLKNLYNRVVNNWKSTAEAITNIDWAGVARDIVNTLGDAFSSFGRNAWEGLKDSFESVFDFEIPGFQHGGIVPGPVGSPMPIIAHGGERIVPRTGAQDSAGAGPNITVNISGDFSLDSSERVHELAKQIAQIIGRQAELAELGLIY